MKKWIILLTVFALPLGLNVSQAKDANFTVNVAGAYGDPTGVALSSTLLHVFGLNDSNLKLNLRAGAEFDFSGRYAVNLDALATLEQLDYNVYGGSTLGFLNGGVAPGVILGGTLFLTDSFDFFLEGQYAFNRGLNARVGVSYRF